MSISLRGLNLANGTKVMAKKVYNRLVRDKIVGALEADGKIAKSKVLNNQQYLEELVKNLVDESNELSKDRSVARLADIQELVLAIAGALDIEPSDLASTMANKAVEQGAFKKRIYLESVE